MKTIPLTAGKFALVDDDLFDELSQYTWCYSKTAAKRHLGVKEGGDKMIFMHREILGVTDSHIFVDHRDGNPLNNQRANLRLCTNAENLANRGKTRANTSGYKGVCWHKGAKKWLASIRKNGKAHSLGLFEHKEDAARAYDVKAKELFGDFACLNFTEER